ncbi:hypothetical protein D6T64_03180 [Cryobacterium melibiosiphilum]|uniref:DUF2771 family protein n=1 Tax=Cryobacterium melibiosiphilum TaxID=995039 RepID=A0A3A5MNV3_9MICO|nr:hypothetical protein [Cryobacterium melibiosiphilum]RJT90016.1 hypothetical protein D6T64_04930 [Cryobacterium melibiosiphilum]RJT90751.1 hypothetical protein D6T64_03180 [Cryobacterium melibiosiphilum]
MANAGSKSRDVGLVSIGAALIAIVALAGCSTSSYVNCPAIGWGNTVAVTLDGAIGEVSTVQMCIDDQCSIPALGEPATDEPVQVETLRPQDRETYTPSPSAWESPYFASQVDDHSWEIALTMEVPENATLRALSANEDILAEKGVALVWVRVGGSEQCGGPSEAGPVTLTIAS